MLSFDPNKQFIVRDAALSYEIGTMLHQIYDFTAKMVAYVTRTLAET